MQTDIAEDNLQTITTFYKELAVLVKGLKRSFPELKDADLKDACDGIDDNLTDLLFDVWHKNYHATESGNFSEKLPEFSYEVRPRVVAVACGGSCQLVEVV